MGLNPACLLLTGAGSGGLAWNTRGYQSRSSVRLICRIIWHKTSQIQNLTKQRARVETIRFLLVSLCNFHLLQFPMASLSERQEHNAVGGRCSPTDVLISARNQWPLFAKASLCLWLILNVSERNEWRTYWFDTCRPQHSAAMWSIQHSLVTVSCCYFLQQISDWKNRIVSSSLLPGMAFWNTIAKETGLLPSLLIEPFCLDIWESDWYGSHLRTQNLGMEKYQECWIKPATSMLSYVVKS